MKATVHKASPLRDEESPTGTIMISRVINRDDHLDKQYAQDDAVAIAAVLSTTLPGATFDLLLAEMMGRARSRLIVSYEALSKECREYADTEPPAETKGPKGVRIEQLEKQLAGARDTAMGYASIALSEGALDVEEIDDVDHWVELHPEGEGARVLREAIAAAPRYDFESLDDDDDEAEVEGWGTEGERDA